MDDAQPLDDAFADEIERRKKKKGEEEEEEKNSYGRGGSHDRSDIHPSTYTPPTYTHFSTGSLYAHTHSI